MDLYFGCELPKKVIDCLLSVPDEQFGFHKDTVGTKEQVVESLNQACRNGKVYIIYENNVVLFLTDQAPYVLHLDSVRGTDSSIFDYIKLIKKMIKMMTEKTLIHKIETRTPFMELETVIKRGGWKVEGRFAESYQMPDGTFADEISIGCVLKRTKEQETYAMNLLKTNILNLSPEVKEALCL